MLLKLFLTPFFTSILFVGTIQNSFAFQGDYEAKIDRARNHELSDREQTMVSNMNADGLSGKYQFDLEWVKNSIGAETAYMKQKPILQFFLEQLPSSVMQLAKKDPIGFMQVPGLYYATYDFPLLKNSEFSHELRLFVLEESLDSIVGLEQVEMSKRMMALSREARPYRAYYEDSPVQDHASIYGLFDDFIEKHLLNQYAYPFYAQIIAYTSPYKPFTNAIAVTPAYSNLGLALATSPKNFVWNQVRNSMERQRFPQEWMKKIFAIAKADPSGPGQRTYNIPAETYRALQAGPTQRVAYLRDLAQFISTESAGGFACNAYLRTLAKLEAVKQKYLFPLLPR